MCNTAERANVAHATKAAGSWDDDQVHKNRIDKYYFYAIGFVGFAGLVLLIVALSMGTEYLWQVALGIMGLSYVMASIRLKAGDFKSYEKWKSDREKPLKEHLENEETKKKVREQEKKSSLQEKKIQQMGAQIKFLMQIYPNFTMPAATERENSATGSTIHMDSRIEIPDYGYDLVEYKQQDVPDSKSLQSLNRRLTEDEVDASTAALAVLLCLLSFTLFHMIWKRFQPTRVHPRYGAY